MMQTKLFNGLTIYTHQKDDYISKSLHYNKMWEPNVTYFIQKCSTKDGVFVDVGANLGYHSLVACKLYARCLLFEPLPQNSSRILQSIAHNKLTNMTLIQNGVGKDDNTLVSMVVLHHNMGGSKNIELEKLGAQPGRSIVTDIKVTTLDSACKDMPKIRLMKIDVEGFELEVLQGFRHGLSLQKVDYFIIELSPTMMPISKCVDILKLLVDNKYYLYDIGLEEKGRVAHVKSFVNITGADYVSFISKIHQTNILASHKYLDSIESI